MYWCLSPCWAAWSSLSVQFFSLRQTSVNGSTTALFQWLLPVLCYQIFLLTHLEDRGDICFLLPVSGISPSHHDYSRVTESGLTDMNHLPLPMWVQSIRSHPRTYILFRCFLTWSSSTGGKSLLFQTFPSSLGNLGFLKAGFTSRDRQIRHGVPQPFPCPSFCCLCL